MDRWLSERETFLRCMLESEAPPSCAACVGCGGAMLWRCDDCFGQPTYCKTCCCDRHLRLPFHRVRMWNGQTFCKSSLRKTGLVLYLGHRGEPCPGIAPFHHQTMHRAQRDIEDRDDDTSRGKDPGQPPDQDQAYEAEFFRLFGLTSLLSLDTPATSSRPSPSPSTLPSTHLPSVDVEAENRALPSFCASPSQVLHSLEQLEAESDEEYFQFESGGLKSNVFHFPKGYDQQGNQWMTITDITGVHSLPVHFCSCSIAKRPYLQLLELGIYPVTYDRPQSAFTFRLLDDFDIDNLETKSSAQSYYEKLRRLTSNTYPYLVPDRYREFMTCARQWRNLNQHKRAGTLFEEQSSTERGRLANFCPACPQPGVNLPDDWEKDKDE